MELSERQKLINQIQPRLEEKTGGVGIEDVLEAEFLLSFGWEAYWDIYPEKDRSVGISLKEMNRLLNASRKVRAREAYDHAQSIFIGAVASQSGKKANQVFKSATSKLVKEMQPDG